MNNSKVYKCIHEKLKQESDPESKLERRKLLIIFGRFYHFPKEIRNEIIKDLENQGLIKVVNKFVVEVK